MTRRVSVIISRVSANIWVLLLVEIRWLTRWINYISGTFSGPSANYRRIEITVGLPSDGWKFGPAMRGNPYDELAVRFPRPLFTTTTHAFDIPNGAHRCPHQRRARGCFGWTLSTPLQTMGGGVSYGRGQPSCKISAPAQDFFKPARKQLSAPPENEKNIALAFLKAARLQIPYWAHFTFNVSNPIYMCALPPSK
jgi:hypothetical protein